MEQPAVDEAMLVRRYVEFVCVCVCMCVCGGGGETRGDEYACHAQAGRGELTVDAVLEAPLQSWYTAGQGEQEIT